METKVKNKTKGISLIVLVITILVLAILAATVIISLSNTNVISEASKSVLKSDLTTMQDMATVYMADNYNLVDVEREYLITEFGITDEKYKGYETIATVKAGKVYIKPNAPENVKEVAQELNILIDGVSADNGNVTLDKTATGLKIYGNSIDNTTTNVTQSVGDKTKNLVNIPDVEIKQTNNYYAQTTITTSQVLNVIEEALENGAISISFDIDGENIDKFSKEIAIYYTNTSGERKYITRENLNNITKPDDWESMISFYLRARSDSADYKGTVIKVSNIQVEKGVTATDYEPYGYKIPITMTGKNLFDFNKLFDGDTFEKADITYTKTENGILSNGTSSNFAGTTAVSVKELLEVGKTYIVSGHTGGVSVIFMSKINGTPDYSNKKTITGEESDVGVYIQVAPNTTVNNALVMPQLEEGENATDYEHYTERKYNIYLSEPLRKVGNMADYINFETGEVLRYIGVNSTTGALEVLNTPKREKITIENMNFAGMKHIFVNTKVVPSNTEVKY